MGGAIHCEQSIAQWCLLSYRCAGTQEEQGGQVRRRNQETMEHSSTPPLLLLSSTMYVFPYFALYAGALCRHKTNEWIVGIPERAGTAAEIYPFAYCQFLFICRLAWFECFLCLPSNMSAPKAALRLSCCLKPGFMASKSRCRRLSTHGKRLRKYRASEPTFMLLLKIKLEVSDDLKSKFQSLSNVCLIKQPLDSYVESRIR